jgi:DNA-binding NarL/FixJ family response regulator
VTTVVLADDQELVRSGLRGLLEARGIEVVGEAGDGRADVAVARQQQPDVVVMDIRMPLLDGIAATRELVASGSPSRVLIPPPTTSTATCTTR